jgi:hypothetical protein
VIGALVAWAVRAFAGARRAALAAFAIAAVVIASYALFPRGTSPEREISYTRYIAGVMP